MRCYPKTLSLACFFLLCLFTSQANLISDIVSELKNLNIVQTFENFGTVGEDAITIAKEVIHDCEGSGCNVDSFMQDSTLIQSVIQALKDTFETVVGTVTGHPVDCASCKLAYGIIPDSTKKSLMNKAFDLLDSYCKESHSAEECTLGINAYGQIIFDSLFGHYMNADYACQITFPLCNKTMTVENVTEYILNVTSGEPNTPLPTPAMKSTFRVLQVSDMHLDPFYLANATVNCPDTVCCRQVPNTTDTDGAELSGYWGTLAACDLPYRTAEQMAIFISENVPAVDLIIWTGDNSQHDIAKTSDQNINNTLYLTSLFKQYFPGVPVYPCMGNHETYPLETWGFNFDPTAYTDSDEKTFQQDQQSFESTFSNEWLGWLGQDAINEFAVNGFFSSYNEEYQVRIISLNTNACHDDNFYLLLDPTDPGGMLAWLEQTLATSEQNSENVYIIGHIPPGSSDCYTQWSDRFSALIERYAYIIRGQFFGHLHSDSFFLYKSYAEPNKTVQMGFQVSSMTPNYQRNPSFRVYTVDTDTAIPVNYDQYRLDLASANANNNQTLYWNVAYDFLSAYNMTSMNLDSFDTLREQVYTDANVYQTFVSNYGAGISSGGPSQSGFYCGVLSTIDQQDECLTELNITVSMDKTFTALSMLSGDWINKTISS